MATNYVSEGDALELTAPVGGVSADSPYKIGAIFGIATVSADAGDKFVLATEGVWTLPKVSTEPWSEGALIYFITTSGLVTSTSAGGLMLIGAAAAATVNPSSTGNVRLNGDARAVGYS